MPESTDENRPEHLRESERRFRATFEQAAVGMAHVGLDGRWLCVNQKFCDIVGYSRDELMGLTFQDITHPADLQLDLDYLHRLLADEITTYSMEKRYVCKDGSSVWINLTVSLARKPHGEPDYLISVVEDITPRKKAEQLLIERDRMHRIVADNTYDFEFWRAPDGRYVYVSPSCERISGHKPADFLADPALLGRLVHDEDRARFDEGMKALMAAPSAAEFEFRIVHRDGTVRWLAKICQPVYGEQGEFLGLRGSNRDITDRKLAEQALRDADRHKDQFLATLAHELRNPLAPLRNSLNLLRVSQDDSTSIGLVRGIMERQVDQMVHLIDDLLDVSRISNGKLELRKQLIDLASVVTSAVETAQPLIDAAEHQLAISLPPTPTIVNGDPVRLAQVIANLLNNAAKYTKPGGQIWLTMRNEGDQAVISVRDNGVGIPADMLPRVFDMFAQVADNVSRSQGGLGIGLTLTKSFVEMHGGRLEARSGGVGQGSEFLVRLPTTRDAPLPSMASSPRHKPSVSRRRILIVDDSRAAAFVLGKLLEKLGHEVRIADGAPSAIEIACCQWPELVISDIGMPTIDGYELARRLRKMPGLEELKLVALTGYGQEKDMQLSREAGFDHHLVKPISLDALQDMLASLPPPLPVPYIAATSDRRAQI
jgi:PAS domain S-box-containing protein